MCLYQPRPAHISIAVCLYCVIGIPWDYLESGAFLLEHLRQLRRATRLGRQDCDGPVRLIGIRHDDIATCDESVAERRGRNLNHFRMPPAAARCRHRSRSDGSPNR